MALNIEWFLPTPIHTAITKISTHNNNIYLVSEHNNVNIVPKSTKISNCVRISTIINSVLVHVFILLMFVSAPVNTFNFTGSLEPEISLVIVTL